MTSQPTSHLPDAVLELIRDHATYPQRNLAVSDIFNFRLVCRRWNRSCGERFWMRWMRTMGFGRHLDQYSSTFPIDILPASQVYPKCISLRPAYALVQRRPLWGSQRLRVDPMMGDVYDLTWVTSARFATWPPVNGFLVGVDEYIPILEGFDQILVTNDSGVTIVDFWQALDDWFDKPLTESQQIQLRDTYFPELCYDEKTAPKTLIAQNWKKIAEAYPNRGSLATRPFGGVRQSKVGSLMIPLVWQGHETGGSWEPLRDARMFAKQAKTRIHPAIATVEDVQE